MENFMRKLTRTLCVGGLAVAAVSALASQVVNASEMYFTNTNSGVKTIEKILLNGTGRTTIMTRTTNGIGQIKVDAANNVMFWLEERPAGTKWSLMRANLDGTNVQQFTDQVLSGAAATLQLDKTGQRVYWLDASGNNIKSYAYDGTNPQTNWQAVGYDPNPRGLGLDAANGKFYISRENNPTTTGVFEILEMDLDGTNQVVRAAPRNGVKDIQLDLDSGLAYYTRRSSGTQQGVSQFNMAGPLNQDAINLSGTITADAVGSLALDTESNRIYYSSPGGGKVYVSDFAGNASIFLDTNVDGVSGLDIVYSIPEPGSLALLGFGGAMVLSSRRRSHD